MPRPVCSDEESQLFSLISQGWVIQTEELNIAF
jgi:hypothetical protein